MIILITSGEAWSKERMGGGTNCNIGTDGGVRATVVDMRRDCRVGVEREIKWPGVGVGRKAKLWFNVDG